MLGLSDWVVIFMLSQYGREWRFTYKLMCVFGSGISEKMWAYSEKQCVFGFCIKYLCFNQNEFLFDVEYNYRLLY